MNIITNTAIREKYNQGFERSCAIEEIILHNTGGGNSASGLINWMLGGERSKQYKKGIALFHYLIDYDGKVIEIIDPLRWVYHSSSGKHDKKTIGIELMNSSMSNNSPNTHKQYESLFYLIFDILMPSFPTIKIIMSHNRAKQKYSGGSKNCPGDKFRWDLIEKQLEENNYLYDHNPHYESYFNIRKG